MVTNGELRTADNTDVLEQPLDVLLANCPKTLARLKKLGLQTISDAIEASDEYLLANGLTASQRIEFLRALQAAGIGRPKQVYIGALGLPAELDKRLRRLQLASVYRLERLSRAELLGLGFSTNDCKAISRALTSCRQPGRTRRSRQDAD